MPNLAKKDSPKIKKYEVAYNAWMKAVFKSFGKYLLAETLKCLQDDTNLSPQVIENFRSRVNFDFINKIFDGILTQNIKYFENLLKKKAEKSSVTPLEKFIQIAFPQTIVNQREATIGAKNKKMNFFELEKDIVDTELTENYRQRELQLDEFRQSYLFNSPRNLEKFKEKYPEPTYRFVNSTSRTQINNLNRDLNASFATNLGIKKCIWRTSGDERVRESHHKLNGKTFSYSNLPVEYNDYNCRCTLEPIIE